VYERFLRLHPPSMTLPWFCSWETQTLRSSAAKCTVYMHTWPRASRLLRPARSSGGWLTRYSEPVSPWSLHGVANRWRESSRNRASSQAAATNMMPLQSCAEPFD